MKRIRELGQYLSEQRVPLYAANASFFLILSIFPMLVVLLALMRYTGLQVETFTDLLDGVIPGTLMPTVNRLVLSAYVNSTGTMVSISAIAALWSASRGMYSFVTGLNAVYEVRENRGYLWTRLLSVGYTFAFLMVLVLTLVLQKHLSGIVIITAVVAAMLFMGESVQLAENGGVDENERAIPDILCAGSY